MDYECFFNRCTVIYLDRKNVCFWHVCKLPVGLTNEKTSLRGMTNYVKFAIYAGFIRWLKGGCGNGELSI